MVGEVIGRKGKEEREREKECCWRKEKGERRKRERESLVMDVTMHW